MHNVNRSKDGSTSEIEFFKMADTENMLSMDLPGASESQCWLKFESQEMHYFQTTE